MFGLYMVSLLDLAELLFLTYSLAAAKNVERMSYCRTHKLPLTSRSYNYGPKSRATYMVCRGNCPRRTHFFGLTAALRSPPTCRGLSPDLTLFPSAIGMQST